MKTTDRRLADLEQIVRGSYKVRPTNPIACRVYSGSVQALTSSGTAYALSFENERWDEHGMHGTALTRITAPVSGWYSIWGGVEYAANGTGVRDLLIRMDGSVYLAFVRQQAPTADAAELVVSTLYYLTAGQYVELVARQYSTGALNIGVAANRSPEFAVTMIK